MYLHQLHNIQQIKEGTQFRYSSNGELIDQLWDKFGYSYVYYPSDQFKEMYYIEDYVSNIYLELFNFSNPHIVFENHKKGSELPAFRTYQNYNIIESRYHILHEVPTITDIEFQL